MDTTAVLTYLFNKLKYVFICYDDPVFLPSLKVGFPEECSTIQWDVIAAMLEVFITVVYCDIKFMLTGSASSDCLTLLACIIYGLFPNYFTSFNSLLQCPSITLRKFEEIGCSG